jgi:hypothetical protein
VAPFTQPVERTDPVTPMSKPVDDILQSILDEFAVSKQSRDELVARALFRLLNYCPVPAANVPQLGRRVSSTMTGPRRLLKSTVG